LSWGFQGQQTKRTALKKKRRARLRKNRKKIRRRGEEKPGPLEWGPRQAKISRTIESLLPNLPGPNRQRQPKKKAAKGGIHETK